MHDLLHLDDEVTRFAIYVGLTLPYESILLTFSHPDFDLKLKRALLVHESTNEGGNKKLNMIYYIDIHCCTGKKLVTSGSYFEPEERDSKNEH